LRGLQSRILLVLCIPSANCAKKMPTANNAVIIQNNVEDHKRNDNAVASVVSLNFPALKI